MSFPSHKSVPHDNWEGSVPQLSLQLQWNQISQVRRIPGAVTNFDPTQLHLALTCCESLIRQLAKDGVMDKLHSALTLECNSSLLTGSMPLVRAHITDF